MTTHHQIVLAVVDLSVGLVAESHGQHTALVAERGLTWGQLAEAADHVLTNAERAALTDLYDIAVHPAGDPVIWGEPRTQGRATLCTDSTQ